MPSIDRVRRAVVGAVLAGTTAGGLFTPARSYLDRFAPLSGSVWESAVRDRPTDVPNPYGPATVTYDEYGVPHVSADNEMALYFAVGFVQAEDRLFQLDLLRRVMRGEIAEVVGEVALESDRFNVSMDFLGAAEATWGHVSDTAAGPPIEAFAEGVNASRDRRPLPVEFSLLDYEPDPWTPVDSMLMEKQISWGLTGSFEPLHRATLRDALGPETTAELFPKRLDHETPILGESQIRSADRVDGVAADYEPLLSWVSEFESGVGIGSNSWVVSGTHTESGEPIVANDPHLDLRAPPVWYQQHLSAPEYWVRGVTFPGVPFVIIGENHAGAWGFTNVGADVVDHYRYDVDGDAYRYGGETRRFETEERSIQVADGDDETVTVRKSVHGPVIEREGLQVAVAWTGLTATETTLSVYEMAKSNGLDDFEAATRRFDLPTQNVVYADRDGNTYYHVTGRIPIRREDGREIRGDRIFDGSEPEGEWEGFTPYGESTWEGFVPFEEKPGATNPDVLATANQRVVDDPEHYIGTEYAAPFRGKRIYDRLEAATDGGPVTPRTMREIQRDTFDERASMLVPSLEGLGGELSSKAQTLLDTLLDWDYRMAIDSRGALVFARFFGAYKAALFADEFETAGLSASERPGDWVAITIDPGSPWFDRARTPDSKEAALRAALETAADRLEENAETVYGDLNIVEIDHPFDQEFLNYPRIPTGGSSATVMNFRRDSSAGSSWRMVVPMDGEGSVVLPGGNRGNPFGDHYADQLRSWARGRYLEFERETPEEADITFTGEQE